MATAAHTAQIIPLPSAAASKVAQPALDLACTSGNCKALFSSVVEFKPRGKPVPVALVQSPELLVMLAVVANMSRKKRRAIFDTAKEVALNSKSSNGAAAEAVDWLGDCLVGRA